MQNLLYLKPTITENLRDTTPLAIYECKGSKFLTFLYPLESQAQDSTIQDSHIIISHTTDSKIQKSQAPQSQILESQTKKPQPHISKNDSNNKANPAPTDYTAKHHILRQEAIAHLQELHKKAVHFVWAFRILNEYNHIIEGSSDDGEPKGSAGAPMLEVLRGENLINTLCICVRYFGGTKLGVGGLVRAYTKATKDAICKAHDKALLKPYTEQRRIALHAKSNLYYRILHLAKSHNLTLFDKEFQADSMTLHLQGDIANIENFLQEYSTL